ncbi:cytochrome P450 ClCP1 [Emericellopsis atlantica]|uniref:Cytochrome P450 ClCP1 n=1 Tax=Emericellopsis atlantica TaxID=2614577 RepID=A0A9P8CKZ0_9HYPO|nr:cytochrome P450 ClCP1 [Emericellopsis atlantica]KAG9251084.1 cytochrome P450 ClCP1 [Emericellopsis atlantica]
MQFLALFGLVAAIGLASVAYSVVYNLYFHPLNKFPGPLVFRATRLGFAYKLVTGSIPFDVLRLHEKYGDVVRISPDQLAFAHPQAWKDIMGHQTTEMPKYKNYYSPVAGTPQHIVNAEREEHAALRRALSHGFSERSIRDQQTIIKPYIDLLIERLHQKCDNGVTTQDMVMWYNYTMFDVIGDLSFGESFGCLESGEYHPWVRSFFNLAQTGTYLYGASWWPTLQKMIIRSIPKKSIQEQIQMYMMAVQKTKKRMDMVETRADFAQALLDRRDKIGLNMQKLEANANTLVVAGSETTATAMSGMTFYLLKNPEVHQKLKDEIRGAFNSDEEIDFNAVSNLPYLQACINETLRAYPPTPSGLPRTVPAGGATICGQFVPENTVVAIYQWAMHNRRDNFQLPNEFHPERFLDDERFKDDNKDAFQAFHVGPRACIGKNLAYLEMRAIMARIIYNFDMELSPDCQDWMSRQRVFDVWEKDELKVHLTPVSR